MPKGKRKVKIKFRQQALIHKKDKTRVARKDLPKRLPVKRVVPDNGATFKVKIRKKE